MGKNRHRHSDAIGGVVVSTRNKKHDRGQQGCTQGLEGFSDADGCSSPVYRLSDSHALSRLQILQLNPVAVHPVFQKIT